MSTPPSTNAAVLDAAWAAAWADFLSNRIEYAERRAAPFLLSLPHILERSADGAAGDEDISDQLVTLADLAYIAGAARADPKLLSLAVDAYDEHLRRSPSNHEAMRMRAETLLRCRQYAEAFEGFRQLYEHSLRSVGDAGPDGPANGIPSAEVAPFQLLHDAECIEHAVELGADAGALATAAAWRKLAAELTEEGAAEQQAAQKQQQTQDVDLRSAAASTRYFAVGGLSVSHRALLGRTFGAPLPLPPSVGVEAAHAAEGPALRVSIDWAAACDTYASKRLLVIDDLLSASTLAALQAYTRHGAHFRTLRRGYLGAFPADGTTHPLILRLATELAAAAPAIFARHALAMWWIFKYDSTTNPEGIGIHADPAAVNINLWLTDDAACLDGGGLVIYSHVPPLEQATHKVNREFRDASDEASLRESLAGAGATTTVQYKCNRACIFVSDQYHESLPFRFAPGYAQRRANLTLLFGDRWSPLPPARSAAAAAATSGGAGAAADGWDAFEVPRPQPGSSVAAGVAAAVASNPSPDGAGTSTGGWDVFD